MTDDVPHRKRPGQIDDENPVRPPLASKFSDRHIDDEPQGAARQSADKNGEEGAKRLVHTASVLASFAHSFGG